MSPSETRSHPHRQSEKIRILVIGFAYIVGVYQSKLQSLQDTGDLHIAWVAPKKWKMRTWNRTIPLEKKYPDIHVYPVNIRFLNGVNGGYLYPTLPLLDVIRRFKPDILHYEQEVFSLSAFQAAFWAKILRIPLTVFCWENVEKKLPFYRQWTTQFVLSTAKAIVAGNRDAAAILRSWGYTRNIIVMPQIGVNTDLFFARKETKRDDVFTIGFLGRLVPEKGVGLIFSAARHLLENGTSLRIIICGSGSQESALRAHAERSGLVHHITWLGAVAHDVVPDVLADMDVVILPSQTLPGIWREQFGHVLIEAMAMGIPVIGSDSGAIPEVIGRQDLIFRENNPEELAQILKKLIVDREWAAEVSRFLEERAIREYSDQRISELLVSMWKDSLSETSLP